jgi:hypothetical protein
MVLGEDMGVEDITTLMENVLTKCFVGKQALEGSLCLWMEEA